VCHVWPRLSPPHATSRRAPPKASGLPRSRSRVRRRWLERDASPDRLKRSVRKEPKQRNGDDYEPTEDADPGPLDDPSGAMPLLPFLWEFVSLPRPLLFAMPQVVNA
jgi:hypothetical protein